MNPEERWDQFVHIVSHDLKAPARAIENLCQWIQEELGPDPKAELVENLALLKGRASRLGRLVDDLYEYSNVGSQPRALARVELEHLAKEILAALPKKQGIKVEVVAGMPAFSAAVLPLRQVLFHILSNAVKHHDKAEGWVKISALEMEAQGMVEISVADNGPGIPPNQQERIFFPCQTLRSKDEVEGSGMGLAIVSRVLELEGGKIRVESAPGDGSRFIVSWPKGREAQP
jgi:signal transduction histidine kinase